MISAILLPALLSATPQEAHSTETMDVPTITVAAERLRDFRGRWHLPDTGSAVCEVRRSTGDDTLDTLACEAILQCVDENLMTIARGRDRSLARAERRAAVQQTRTVMRDCSTQRLRELERHSDD